MEMTFAMIKPDATQKGFSGKIIDLIEHAGFEIVKMEKMCLPKGLVEAFYAVHKERSFFPEVVQFMTSGAVIALVLKKNNAVAEWRNLMGATNPSAAEEGTIRKLFGADVMRNATHGSDSAENAKIEIELIFQKDISSICC